MRVAGLNKNDFTAAPGTSVTLYVQGCPHHCPGCHNPETWDYDDGEPMSNKLVYEIINSLNANGITRAFCVQGGEPLCPENVEGVAQIIGRIKRLSPQTKIYIWSGYTLEELLSRKDKDVSYCLNKADVLIDGRYMEELRDITLPMRGSSNQNIINLTNL